MFMNFMRFSYLGKLLSFIYIVFKQEVVIYIYIYIYTIMYQLIATVYIVAALG